MILKQIEIREVLNQKKSVKFHTGGGGQISVIFTFSFLLVLSHANMQRKVFFVGVGGTKSPESVKILDISA